MLPPPPLSYVLPRLCYVTVTWDWFGAFTLCFTKTAVVSRGEKKKKLAKVRNNSQALKCIRLLLRLTNTTVRFLKENVS